ncbi:MAG: hypothetical protein ACKO9Z_15995 [Planctomycetota bacterium]
MPVIKTPDDGLLAYLANFGCFAGGEDGFHNSLDSFLGFLRWFPITTLGEGGGKSEDSLPGDFRDDPDH